MSLALSPSNLKVYRDILGLVWRHGNREALDAIGIGKLVDKVRDDDAPGPDDLAKDLEKLGPTYIKIGQILSTQLNVLPPSYMEAMARLQDHVEPLPPETIHGLIEKAFGKPASEVFAEFDDEPLGSASISQVHRAVTHGGEVVAVKIQRPKAKAADRTRLRRPRPRRRHDRRAHPHALRAAGDARPHPWAAGAGTGLQQGGRKPPADGRAARRHAGDPRAAGLPGADQRAGADDGIHRGRLRGERRRASACRRAGRADRVQAAVAAEAGPVEA